MWISRFRLQNFSSFSDSGWLTLSPKFNLFIGQNNSGKSAILRALMPPIPNNPHKNEVIFRGTNLPVPTVEVDVSIESMELIDNFAHAGHQCFFPVRNLTVFQAEESKKYLVPGISHTLEIKWQAGYAPTPRNKSSIPSFITNENPNSVHLSHQNGEIVSHGVRNGEDNLGHILTEDFGNIFHFDAQRLNIAKSTYDNYSRLYNNARNLPAVLAYLQGARKPIFDKIENHTIDILGGIERITVVPRGNEFEILIWPKRETIFEELSFSLNDSGTGVGQLLAILTAVITSEQSIVIIDEINSFIHPIAVKKLLRVLRSDYPHHQYIISTHSSDAIASCNAEKLYIVKRQEFLSSAREISLIDADQAREIAGHLGFSMMDVFGLDRIIWVEGPTEEICFQYLVRHFDLSSNEEFGFASVSSASALTSTRRDKAIVEIYERAGKKLSPLLKGMAFALDREKLSDEEVEKQERSKRKLRLLPRRCIECYFLDPDAISVVLTELDNCDYSSQAIREVMIVLAQDQKLGAAVHWTGDLNGLPWLKRIDGARLLDQLFRLITEDRVEYRKTRDGISILRHIAENNAVNIEELVAYLRKVIDVCNRDSKP